jgi:hypothetical protein
MTVEALSNIFEDNTILLFFFFLLVVLFCMPYFDFF